MEITHNKFFDSLTDKEVGYLLGLFAGDGYRYHDKKYRHHTVEFYLNSKKDKLIQEFLLRLLGKIKLRVFIHKDERFSCNRVRIYSKSVFDFMSMDSFDAQNTEFGIGFVSGMIDSDGYVDSKKRFIAIINTDIHLLQTCKTLLNKFNIITSVRTRTKSKKDKKISYMLPIPLAIKDISHNSIKITAGFPAGTATR